MAPVVAAPPVAAIIVPPVIHKAIVAKDRVVNPAADDGSKLVAGHIEG